MVSDTDDRSSVYTICFVQVFMHKRKGTIVEREGVEQIEAKDMDEALMAFGLLYPKCRITSINERRIW